MDFVIIVAKQPYVALYLPFIFTFHTNPLVLARPLTAFNACMTLSQLRLFMQTAKNLTGNILNANYYLFDNKVSVHFSAKQGATYGPTKILGTMAPPLWPSVQ